MSEGVAAGVDVTAVVGGDDLRLTLRRGSSPDNVVKKAMDFGEELSNDAGNTGLAPVSLKNCPCGREEHRRNARAADRSHIMYASIQHTIFQQ